MQFNLRDFPDDLHYRMQVRAAKDKVPIKELVISTMESALNGKGDGIVDEAFRVTCPLCGLDGPAFRFGTNLRCFHCGTGFMEPEGI